MISVARVSAYPDAMNPALIALALVLCIAAAVLVAVGATWLLGTFLEWRRFHGR